jgi:hypothetical protein
MASQLPVAVVYRVLGASPSSVDARRASARGRWPARPGHLDQRFRPGGLVCQVLDASPFAGEAIASSGLGWVANTASG